MRKIFWRIFFALTGLAFLLGVSWREDYREFRRVSAPILMYHAVGYESGPDWDKSLVLRPEVFEEHLKFLQSEGYALVSVEELAKKLERGEDAGGLVALSFDDGYRNNHDVVLPLLQKYNAHASFFLINSVMGDAIHMDVQQAKALLDAGMEIGSHTYTHAPLGLTAEKYLPWELSSSRFFLKKNLDGYIVRTLAYPNGSYNAQIIAAAEKYGFYRALTGHVGVNNKYTYRNAPMEMYRVTVSDDGSGARGLRRRIELAYFFGFLQTKGIDINVLRDKLL